MEGAFISEVSQLIRNIVLLALMCTLGCTARSKTAASAKELSVDLRPITVLTGPSDDLVAKFLKFGSESWVQPDDLRIPLKFAMTKGIEKGFLLSSRHIGEPPLVLVNSRYLLLTGQANVSSDQERTVHSTSMLFVNPRIAVLEIPGLSTDPIETYDDHVLRAIALHLDVHVSEIGYALAFAEKMRRDRKDAVWRMNQLEETCSSFLHSILSVDSENIELVPFVSMGLVGAKGLEAYRVLTESEQSEAAGLRNAFTSNPLRAIRLSLLILIRHALEKHLIGALARTCEWSHGTGQLLDPDASIRARVHLGNEQHANFVWRFEGYAWHLDDYEL